MYNYETSIHFKQMTYVYNTKYKPRLFVAKTSSTSLLLA